MYEMLRETLGPEIKDPRKLLANVWTIRDEYTPISSKIEHPWVMIETKHPLNSRYRACLVSTKKISRETDVYLPSGTIDQGRWKLPAYARVSFVRRLHEASIDKGDHKCDLPQNFKQEIKIKLYNIWSKRRKYRKSLERQQRTSDEKSC